MPIDLAYKNIKENFRTFMNDMLLGETFNIFREAKGCRQLRNNSQSNFNGAYIINWGGEKEINKATLAGYIEFVFIVKLQVGFILNQNETDSLTEMSAVNDIETIIKKRINSASWIGTSCTGIKFNDCSEFEFIADSYAISELSFTVRYLTEM